MRLDTAIQELENFSERTAKLTPTEALKLGIEALKYIDTCHHNPNCFHISLLEGETKE